ncbi:MAG TPA: alpha/beta fold hydrolase [Candidatus Saccharimonadia bacterium]|nr:alpha/beta fold hydrolase [Candidatus Saccharimonadia bacterium]
MSERVVLLHGVWLRGILMTGLARRLRAAGYDVEVLDYASVFGGPEIATAALVERCRRRAGDERVHVVGHSLGGLVAIEAARRTPGLVDGRIVCLGSPLRGSRAARALASRTATHWVTGRSSEILCSGVGGCVEGTGVGVIAGRMAFGLGSFVAGLPRPHDGTVAVDETRLDGIADHVEVEATHTGLLFSETAARQTIEFLRNGRFIRA